MNRCIGVLLSLALFLTAVPAVSARAADKGVRIGWIDVQQVIVSCRQGREANRRLEEKAREYRDRFTAEKAKVDEMKKKLASLRTVGSDEAIRSQERAIDRKLQELELDSKYASKDMKEMQKKFLGPVIDELNRVIEKLGREGGYDYILDSRTLLFAGDANNITAAAVKAMNERYQEKKKEK